MKAHTVTVRLSENEAKKLKQNAACTGMSTSQYIRSLINGIVLNNTEGKAQEIAAMLCKIYVRLHEQGLDTNNSLMEELHTLCQTLS